MKTAPDASCDAQSGTAPAAGPSRPAAGHADARALLLRLQEVSPTFRDCKPLALRIDKAILARFPELDRKVVRSAMRLHTNSTRYLKAMEKGGERFALDGTADGEVTAEHRAFAAQTLKERFAEAARRKRDQLREAREREREQEAERRKAEKLQQLVGRFGKGGARRGA
jgi:ProP effector